MRIGDLVERQHQGIVAAAGQQILELRLLERRDQGRDALVDGAGRQALREILARQDFGLGRVPANSAAWRSATSARRQQPLEPAVGIGERRQHGMAAIKPDRLVTAAGRARRAVGAGAHGGACMAGGDGGKSC